MALTLEERGAYSTVLDLIYSHADQLPDDDRFLAGWCGCDVRVWRRIKTRLISLGKLHVDGQHLRNFRATSGVTEALSRVASATEAANIKHAKSRAAANGIKDLDSATASKTHVHRARARQPQPEKKDIPSTESLGADDLGWPMANGHDGSASQLRPPSDHRRRGQRTAGDVLAGMLPATGPPEKRMKRQDHADRDMAAWLTTRGGKDTAAAWALLMAARDPDDAAHTEAARELEGISRENRLGWFAEETA